MGIPLKQLGEHGPQVSVVGLGCNNFGRPGTVTETPEGTRAVLDAALESGITLFDTAELYGQPVGSSERLMGEALAHHDRESFVLATKFGHKAGRPHGAEMWGPRGGRTYIRNALEGSLARLQTDYIDLYQMHTPDPDVPIAQTLEALGELIDEGKVRYIGHTNFSAEQIVEAHEVAESHGLPPFVSAQSEYSPLVRDVETGVLPEVERTGLGFLPYWPLANGLLTGKYSETTQPAGSRLVTVKPELLKGVDWGQLRRYQELCDETGVTMLQATFAWLLSHEMLSSVIAGATSPEQVCANAAAGSVELPDEVLDEIDRIFPILGREEAPQPARSTTPSSQEGSAPTSGL